MSTATLHRTTMQTIRRELPAVHPEAAGHHLEAEAVAAPTGKITKVSIVIPVYNEEENLDQLQTRLNESIPATDYNIICINYIQQQFRLKNHRMLAQQQALDVVCCDFCGPLPDLYRTII